MTNINGKEKIFYITQIPLEAGYYYYFHITNLKNLNVNVKGVKCKISNKIFLLICL